MVSDSCHHVTLARNGVAHVQRCVHCNCVAVHLGPITVRIDPHALEALWAVLGEAAIELREQQQQSQARGSMVAGGTA
jgi:hypothetical protein